MTDKTEQFPFDTTTNKIGATPVNDSTQDDNEHIILVAFSVEGSTREQAQERLLMALPRPKGSPRDPKTVDGVDYPYAPASEFVESWWVAEDDRTDGSDCDSAVFVHMGQQKEAGEVLLTHLLTQPWNVVDR